MRKIICLSIICLCHFHVSSQKSKLNKFILTGTITGSESPVLYLIYVDQNGNDVKDSCRLQQGEFYFKGNIKGPAWAILRSDTKIIDDAQNPNFIDIFLEPGTMTASAQYNHFKEMKIEGSKTQVEYEMLRKQFKTIDENSDSLYEKFSKVNYRFIAAHPGSYVSAYQLMLYKTRWPVDSIKLLYNKLSPSIQNSFYGKEIKATIDEIDNNAVGRMAKEFKTTDIKGNPISLSDFKGKYVLLDFWGSWCVPCRKSIPHLIDLFKKFHDFGLNIIGVAEEYDGTGAAWKKAVKSDGTDIWYNVLSESKINKDKNIDDSQSIVKKFGVHKFPTKLLIDKTGIIIGRYTGTENEAALDKKLDETFK